MSPRAPQRSPGSAPPSGSHSGSGTRETAGGLTTPTSWARSVFLGDTPTEPMPVLDLLRHTPYREAQLPEHDMEEGPARAALDLAVRVGELLLRCGADAPHVEQTVAAVATAAGVRNLEVDLTMQALLLQCTTAAGTAITVLRVVRATRFDYARLIAVHELVDGFVRGDYTTEEAAQAFRRIKRRRRVFPGWAVTSSNWVIAAAATVMVGGGVIAAIWAVLSSIAVTLTVSLLGRRALPGFYLNAAGGFVSTLVAWCALSVVPGPIAVGEAGFAFIVSGGILSLLPGRSMTSSVIDILSGYAVTGSARLVSVTLATLGVGIGVAGALGATFWMGRTFGLVSASGNVLQLASTSGTLASALIGGALIGVFGTITLQSRRKTVLPAAMVCVLGVAAYQLSVRYGGLGPITATAVAAALVGFTGRVWALRINAPGMVLIVPATFGLLPGLSIFRGLFALMNQSGGTQTTLAVLSGITTLLAAFAILLAIATGSTLGERLAVPLDVGVGRFGRGLSGR